MFRTGGLLPLGLIFVFALGGCVSATTKITGSSRAGSEQLLLTGTSDRAISSIDFRPLAGRRVFLDSSKVNATDSGWVIFALRREMARQGLLLVGESKDAETIVEAAVAAYGTDEVDCRLSLTLPSLTALGSLPIPTSSTTDASGLYRKNFQDAAVKLALFAYDSKTRQLVWESDNMVEFGHLDRRFFGTADLSRQSSQPELHYYPPRKLR